MTNFLNGVNIGTPGAYAFYQTTQSRPINVEPFRTCYMVGFASNGVNKNVPTRISNLTDFTNVYGTSASTNSVDLFFKNSQGFGNLYFVNVAIPTRYQIVVTAATAGSYSVTVNGVTKAITVVGGATTTTIAADVISAINNDTVLNKEVLATVGGTSSTVVITSKKPTNTTTAAVTGVIFTLTTTTGTSPSVADYVYTINNTFDPALEAGFVIAPEAFSTFTKSDRLSIQVALENLCSAYRYQWAALIDSGAMSEISNTDRAIAEAATYNSVQGHCSYYYPYLINLDDQQVPPSAAVAGMALYRFVIDGFAEPPAGVNFPLKGVKNVAYKVTWEEQNVANPEGVNCILNKENYGIVVWGARTLSADPNIVFISTRIILNIVINTLNRGYDFDIFNSVGGTATVLDNIQRKTNTLLTTLYQAGLFYGQTTSEAFSVLGDASVQVPSLLQQGLVNMFIWVVPSTIIERLIINIKQTAIGDLEATVALDTAALQSSVEEGTATEGTAPVV
ncbi:tail sheath protein [Nostoc phage A1]|uniref:Tail sheath protein n=1 Tax=Nostoc phage A1 TaxID=1775256 RepID=A0ACD6B8W1_9CAUD|nr:tail sheath protein [Nostoc phage A1]